MVTDADVLKEEYVGIAKEILAKMGVIKFCFCGKTYFETYKAFERNEVFALATTILKQKYGSQQNFVLWNQILNEVWNNAQDGSNCPYCSTDED